MYRYHAIYRMISASRYPEHILDIDIDISRQYGMIYRELFDTIPNTKGMVIPSLRQVGSKLNNNQYPPEGEATQAEQKTNKKTSDQTGTVTTKPRLATRDKQEREKHYHGISFERQKIRTANVRTQSLSILTALTHMPPPLRPCCAKYIAVRIL